MQQKGLFAVAGMRGTEEDQKKKTQAEEVQHIGTSCAVSGHGVQALIVKKLLIIHTAHHQHSMPHCSSQATQPQPRNIDAKWATGRGCTDGGGGPCHVAPRVSRWAWERRRTFLMQLSSVEQLKVGHFKVWRPPQGHRGPPLIKGDQGLFAALGQACSSNAMPSWVGRPVNSP